MDGRTAGYRALLGPLLALALAAAGAGCDDDADSAADPSTGTPRTADASTADSPSADSPSADSPPATPSITATPTAADPVQFRVVAINEINPQATNPPPPEAVAAYDAWQCPGTADSTESDAYLAACDRDDMKYLLEPAVIVGGIEHAEAVIPVNQVNWVVSIDLDGAATKAFSELSQDLAGTERQFAVVLDGEILTAPTMNGLITNGQAQIEGNFTEEAAKELARRLEAGG